MSRAEDKPASARISQFRMAKGITLESKSGQWTKKALSMVVQLPPAHNDEDLVIALTRAEYILDSFLGTPETSGTEPSQTPAQTPTQVPNFDAEDLMKHEWKGKKTGEKTWSKGSTSWGWDFRENFKPETIQALEKGSVTIEEYEFSVTDTIVKSKKKVDKKK